MHAHQLSARDYLRPTQVHPDHFLLANNEAYEGLVTRARSAQDRGESPDKIMRAITEAAQFAASFHTGRFADGRLDNILLSVGQTLHRAPLPIPLPSAQAAAQAPRRRRRVVHVTPTLSLGGHTPLIWHWIQADRESSHLLLLTNQEGEIASRWTNLLQESGGDAIRLPSGTPLQKASWLRQLVQGLADVVMWHMIVPDAVPAVAFSHTDGPAVAIVDHADHMFWLGSSVADILINLRLVGSDLTAQRRFAKRNIVLPIPLSKPQSDISQSQARRQVSIPPDQVVLLSVGRDVKYRPSGVHDFVATSNRMLRRNPEAHLYIAGATAHGMEAYLRTPAHDRLHFLGPVPTELLTVYHAASDLYLESFPYGSQTAMLEAALAGLPVIPAYAPLSPLLVANDESISDLVQTPTDEGAYVALAHQLMQDVGRRREHGDQLRQRVLADHVADGWLARLSAAYSEIDRLSGHRPSPIPATTCEHTPTDVGLSVWSAMRDGRTNHHPHTDRPMLSALRHSAYVAKYAGDFSRARKRAWLALLADPRQLASWRLLAVSLLGRFSHFVRFIASARTWIAASE